MHDKAIIAINQPIDFTGGTLEVSHATDDFISFLIIGDI